MKQRSRANALLIELVLVIFFFMLGSTVLVRLFADARHRTIQARATNVSMAAAQNVAEELYGDRFLLLAHLQKFSGVPVLLVESFGADHLSVDERRAGPCRDPPERRIADPGKRR